MVKPEEGAPGTRWMRCWKGPQNDMNVIQKTVTSCFYWESDRRAAKKMKRHTKKKTDGEK
jgi:hypothetical protein